MKRLNDIPKKDNFKAPDGYFEALPDKIRDKIQADKKTDVKPSFFTALKPYLYFTGFFLGLAFVIKLGLNVFTGDYHNPVMADNTTQSETEYFEYELITEDLIYSELTTEESDTETLSEDAILAYLTQDEVYSLVYFK